MNWKKILEITGVFIIGIGVGLLIGIKLEKDIQANYNQLYPIQTSTHIIGPTLEEAGLIKLQTDESKYSVYVHLKDSKTCFLIVPVGTASAQEACIN